MNGDEKAGLLCGRPASFCYRVCLGAVAFKSKNKSVSLLPKEEGSNHADKHGPIALHMKGVYKAHFLVSNRAADDTIRHMKSYPTVNRIAPAFSLPDQAGKMHTLKEYRGAWVVLYFYPKDDTPGCTVEACSFRDNFVALKKAGAIVLGVSVDPVRKHAKFAEKYSLPFALLADEEKQVVERYGVWGKKKFMGREYMGTNRVSFLIDPKGKLVKIYDPVKPTDHVAEVLADIQALATA